MSPYSNRGRLRREYSEDFQTVLIRDPFAVERVKFNGRAVALNSTANPDCGASAGKDVRHRASFSGAHPDTPLD